MEIGGRGEIFEAIYRRQKGNKLIPKMRQERVLKLIKDVLSRHEGVIFSYAYGSFVRGEPFRDVDIAIYLKSPQENPWVISSDIKTELSRAAKDAVDRIR